MSDVIRLLPDSVANQIAAGEVIQRPSSVIKELVENAVDAGATSINIVITDAGKTCIQVIDNGKGMSVTDARMAFERHATSKIRMASDLFALHTMGFRGEALASIAAVAQVELRTRTEDEEVGTSIVIEGSQVKSQEPVACPKGSNFMVKNLFYNVPARRKFLKSDHTELSNILAEMERIMLVNPGISFTMRHNGNDLYSYLPSTTKKRIVDIFGRKTGQQLLHIAVTTQLATIDGFIGTPASSRKKAQQFFFVNGRYMRHPYFNKAVMEAYDKIIPAGEQVPYFIYFTVDPASIDVNIHPTKTEIKFENEQSIWQILLSAVREGIAHSSSVPAIDFDTDGMPDIPPLTSGGKTDVPRVSVNDSYNPFDHGHKRDSDNNWRELYEGLRRNDDFDAGSWDDDLANAVGGGTMTPAAPDDNANTIVLESKSNETFFTDESDKTSIYFQYKGRYILTSVASGLLIIDQHHAHVRILYDRFRRMIDRHDGNSQGLLFPEILTLSPSEEAMMPVIADDMQALGFEITNLGGGSYSISAVPPELNGADYVKVIGEMLRSVADRAKDVKDDLRTSMALNLAKSSAIPYGQVLSTNEMDNLVAHLLALPDHKMTPDGKRTIVTIKDDELNKMF